jgi:hypothetical protein
MGQMMAEVDGLGQQTWQQCDAGEAGLLRQLGPVREVQRVLRVPCEASSEGKIADPPRVMESRFHLVQTT